MGYSNSPLVSYTNLTKNHSGQRNHAIDTITIHCIVAQWTAKQGCDYFATTDRQCSANYVVGRDGDIGLSVEEKNRSWCSSSSSNDNRAITIEVASDTQHPYAVTDKALSALIQLCADICKRNNIKELKWKNDKNLIGQVDKQNMTIHQWFANKACPGQYLLDRHPYIVEEVNKILKGEGGKSDSIGDMSREELKKFIEDTVKSMGSGLPAATWASKDIQSAKEKGLTDGSNPLSYAKRQEVMVISERVLDYVEQNYVKKE